MFSAHLPPSHMCKLAVISTLLCFGTEAFTPPTLSCSQQTVPDESFPELDDSLKKGDVLFTTNDGDDGIVNITNCNGKEMLAYNSSAVSLNASMQSLCINKFECNFKCAKDNYQIVLFKEIKRTLPYSVSFAESVYNASVQEMVAENTSVRLNKDLGIHIHNCFVSDFQDLGRRFTVSKSGPHVPFSWRTETNVNSLEVKGVIDYEANTSFTFYVTVSVPSLNLTGSTEAKIVINVIDIDDNDPKFSIPASESYVLNITEQDNDSVNTPLETSPPVYAFDPDRGINQAILYSIRDQQPDRGLFNITSDGKITVMKPLDYEEHTNYRIIIQAAQKDKPTVSTALATVIVNVIDIDDHHPEYEKPSYNCSAQEHSVQGTVICTVKAIDNDTLFENKNFEYIIWDNQSVVAIKGQGEIVVSNSTAFDSDEIANRKLILKLGTNTTNGTLGGNATVIIELVDINDNNPIFSENEYTFDISNATVGEDIGKVMASDKDAGNNGEVIYTMLPLIETSECTIDSDVKTLFKVNETTGSIILVGVAFCKSYQFSVQACDRGTSRRCSIATVQIQKINTSHVENATQSLEVYEGMPKGHYIDRVLCSGRNNSYQLHNVTDFAIEVNASMLTTNEILDRERNEFYNFVYEVRLPGSKLLCTVNTSVTVLDINDNAPVFENEPYHFMLSPTPENGQTIGTIMATDNDLEANGNISYYFGNERESRFILDALSGEIKIKDKNLVNADIMQVFVVAKDHGTPSIQNSTEIYITGHADKPDAIPISTPLTTRQVMDMRAKLARAISDLLGTDIDFSVVGIENSPSTYKSKLLLTAQAVSKQDFLVTVLTHYEDLRSLFYQSEAQTGAGSHTNAVLGASEIGLIVMAGVILIGTIMAIIIVHRQFNNHKRYRQLYETLTKNSSLYESQEIKVDLDDENSEIQGNVQHKELDSSDTPGLAVAAVNPVYKSETDLTTSGVTDDPEGVTSETSEYENTEVKQALQQLKDSYVQEDNMEKKDESEPGSQATRDKHDYENTNIVYAQVEMPPDNQSNNFTEGDEAEADLIRFGNENVDDAKPADEEKESVTADEPNPDYDVKQVRFHSEVLDADENKLEPLKNKGEDFGEDNVEPEIEQTVEEPDGASAQVTELQENEENVDDEATKPSEDTERLEEEIATPGAEVPYADQIHDQFYFGDIESTQF